MFFVSKGSLRQARFLQKRLKTNSAGYSRLPPRWSVVTPGRQLAAPMSVCPSGKQAHGDGSAQAASGCQMRANATYRKRN